MNHCSKLSRTIIIVTFIILLIPSSVAWAQAELPPTDIGASLDSGALAVIVLVIMLVERLLGKILPFLTKSKEAEKITEVKNLSNGQKDLDRAVSGLSDKISDLHTWHNIQDPQTGRMIWYGLGIPELQRTMTAINQNIEVQTVTLKEVANELGRSSDENAKAHTALLSSIHELLRKE
jgi:hypothetical protein